MWDTGEYMAAVKVLGIPHPPGNPFFMLLGHAFASLPIPVSYAAKINIMARERLRSTSDDEFTDKVYALDNRRIYKGVPLELPGEPDLPEVL